MSFFYPLFLFVLGLFIGSFLNVLSDRLPQGISILGRSHCDYCHKTLKWYDLVPLLSYIQLRGNCRYCHHKFSIQYPLSELITGLIFILIYLSLFSFQLPTISQISNLFYYLFMASTLIVIFFADLRHGIIPDKVLLPATIVTLIWLLIYDQSLIVNNLLAALLCFLFFLLILFLTRGRGMGFGDVKFAFLIGLFLGLPLSISALYLAFLTGGGVSFILILWKKKRLKSTVPFGPFLVIGTFLAIFLQSQILSLVSYYF